jgi:glyceraldehyde 3-phosphate dehydrogenase
LPSFSIDFTKNLSAFLAIIVILQPVLIKNHPPMSTVKVAINGFGRIGRLVFRQIYNMQGIEVVAINDLTSPTVLAHLLKYDSAQGRFDANVTATDDSIIVNGETVKIYAQKDPAQIPWGNHGVDVVIESTGFFTDKDKAAAHLTAGAKRVVISAPATGDLKTVVFNVNHAIDYHPCLYQRPKYTRCSSSKR